VRLSPSNRRPRKLLAHPRKLLSCHPQNLLAHHLEFFWPTTLKIFLINGLFIAISATGTAGIFTAGSICSSAAAWSVGNNRLPTRPVLVCVVRMENSRPIADDYPLFSCFPLWLCHHFREDCQHRKVRTCSSPTTVGPIEDYAFLLSDPDRSNQSPASSVP
jgi:hypothetical protein